MQPPILVKFVEKVRLRCLPDTGQQAVSDLLRLGQWSTVHVRLQYADNPPLRPALILLLSVAPVISQLHGSGQRSPPQLVRRNLP